MAKKAAKRGKKKKPAKTPIQAYDLETISKNDLKKYIASLEKELASMRKDCALHSANKEKVMEFLYAKRDSLLNLKQESVVKNTAMDDHIEQFRTLPKKENVKAIIDDREEIRLVMKNSFDDFVVAKSAEIEHMDKELALKKNIADQYRRVEYDQFLYKMALMDANHKTQNVLGDLEAKNDKAIENMLLENVDEILKLNREFTTNKIQTLTSIWEADDDSETKSFAGEIKRMQDFFHGISFNSAEVIKMLRDKLSSLMKESNKTELNLKQIRMENTKLKSSSQPAELLQAKRIAPFSTILHSKRNFESEKKLISLQYTNDILARYLDMISENLNALKKQFTLSLRKIHQKADFRTLLVEEQILSMLRNESTEPGDSNVKPSVRSVVKRDPPKKETNIHDTSNVVNVLNLKFENSDTLFVPPVYNDFWNLRLKYAKK